MTFITTTDPGSARAFYEAALGLDLVEDEGNALVFRMRGAVLRVTVLEDHEPPPYTVLGWQVEDIGATLDALSGRGVRFEVFEGLAQDDRGIAAFPNGDRVAWFRDPAGNMLSVTQFAHPGD